MATSDFDATTSLDSIKAHFYCEIEGVRVRFGDNAPSWNPADSGTNRPIKEYFTQLPQITGQVAEPLNGSTTPHEFTLSIMDVSEEITALFSVADTSGGVTELNEVLDDSEVGVDVVDGSVFSVNDDIYIDRETMRITGIAANTLTVSRGMYGSEAVAHALTDDQGNTRTVQVTATPPFMYTREVVLCEGRTDLLEADVIKFRGYLDSAEEAGGVWTLNCCGNLRRLNCMIGETCAKSSLFATLADEMPAGGHGPDGPEPPTHWLMKLYDATNFQSSGHVIIDEEIIEYKTKNGNNLQMSDNTDFSDNVFQSVAFARGKFAAEILGDGRAWIRKEVPGMSGLPYSLSVWCVEHPVRSIVREIIHSDSIYEHANLSLTRPDPLRAHHVILAFLLSKLGDDDNDATYDILPKGWGAGIDSTMVDKAGIILACEDPLIADIDFSPFAIAEPVDCKEWLEENILRPCHLFFYETDEGKISVARLYSKNEADELTTATALTEDDLFGIPRFSPGGAPMGEFKINIGWHPGVGEFTGEIRVLLGEAKTKYMGTARNYEIDCKTAYDWRFTGGSGYSVSTLDMDIPELLARYLEVIWSNFAERPCPVVEFSVPYNKFIDVQLGQVITLTSTQTPDLKNSDRGIVTETFQVVEAHPNPEQSSVDLVCWMIGINDDDTRLLAPACKVSSYDAGPPVTVYVTDKYFTDGSLYEYDVDAFVVGDEVMFVDSAYDGLGGGAPAHGDITVVASGAGKLACYVELSGAPADVPGAGDYMVTASYDHCTATQKAKWAYLADATPTLGAASDDPHEYER